MGLNRIAFTVAEFAKASAISKSTAYALIRRGEIAARKCGTRTLILVEDAEKWTSRLPMKSRDEK